MKIDIRSRIEQGLSELVPLKSKEEVEAMATAGPLAIPYLAPRFEYSPQVAAACVQALLQIGSEAAFNALQAYTTDDTSEVTTAFILGLRNVLTSPSMHNVSSRILRMFPHHQQCLTLAFTSSSYLTSVSQSARGAGPLDPTTLACPHLP